MLHIYRAERWAEKGVWPVEYTPGFPALVVAMGAFGLPLMDLARFAPPLLGAASVVGMALLGRRLGGAAAGLGAGLLMAVAPEAIRRATLFAPTALDLALAPILVWLLLDLIEGRLRALAPLAVATLWLYVAHPWGLAYLALALLPVSFSALLRARRVVQVGVLAGLAVAVVPLALFFRPHLAVFTSHAAAWLAAPSLAYTPPRFTEPFDMFGLPLMALALLGAVRGPARMRRLGLGWTLALLPLALFDLTGKDYVPYRTVAFMLPGLALLGGAAVAWLAPRFAAWEARVSPGRAAWAPAAAIGLSLAILAAPAVAMEPWYRISTPEEQALYEQLGATEGAIVVGGSWQAGAWATAWGADGRVHPEFFRDAKARFFVLEEANASARPVFAVVDGHARSDARLDETFLGGQDWEHIARADALDVWRYRGAP